MIEALSETAFTKESYSSFLKDRSFVANHVERDEAMTFFGIIEKTDISQNEEGRNLINFLKSRV